MNNTTKDLITWINNSVKDVTPIENTIFGGLWLTDQTNLAYPMFLLEPPTYTVPTLRVASGVKRDYDLNLWMYKERGDSVKDDYVILEGWMLDALADIERNNGYIVKMADKEYKFTFYEYTTSDRVRALNVNVTYRVNQCYDIE